MSRSVKAIYSESQSKLFSPLIFLIKKMRRTRKERKQKGREDEGREEGIGSVKEKESSKGR